MNRRRTAAAAIGALLFATLAVVVVGVLSPRSNPSREIPPRSAEDRRIRLAAGDPGLDSLADAVAEIRERAVFVEPSADSQRVAADMLKAYLATKDPYSAFLTPEEAEKVIWRKKPYGGIGIDLERTRDGDLIIYPLPDGPADRAGLRPGARLIAIAGVPAYGKSLPELAALGTGPPGSQVMLDVGQGADRSQLELTRAAFEAPTIGQTAYGGLKAIRLSAFAPETRWELEYSLSGWASDEPIIIDLRDCGGGDFYAAVGAAMLFLRERDPIVSVETRQGVINFSSTRDGKPPAQRVILWQNEGTASAAELFIAALTDNDRAVSIGTRSAGKGTRQDIIKLADGAALILTIGYLVTPRAVKFDRRGLDPMIAVEGSEANSTAYIERVRALPVLPGTTK
jgi:carboxyl-terminal processing protease